MRSNLINNQTDFMHKDVFPPDVSFVGLKIKCIGTDILANINIIYLAGKKWNANEYK